MSPTLGHAAVPWRGHLSEEVQIARIELREPRPIEHGEAAGVEVREARVAQHGQRAVHVDACHPEGVADVLMGDGKIAGVVRCEASCLGAGHDLAEQVRHLSVRKSRLLRMSHARRIAAWTSVSRQISPRTFGRRSMIRCNSGRGTRPTRLGVSAPRLLSMTPMWIASNEGVSVET